MRSKLYFEKSLPLIRYARGKDVLDIGIVDHDVGYEERRGWLHGDLKKVAKSLLGIDIDKKSIGILKKKGYNVQFADAEKFNLKKKFDVIVAGDIIEHLNNVSGFLDSVRKHMNSGSLLVLTTPNCLSLSNWIELLIFGRIKYINEQHTHWYDANTIRLALGRAGFAIEELSFISHNPHFLGESWLRYNLKELRHIFQSLASRIRMQSSPTIFVAARLK